MEQSVIIKDECSVVPAVITTKRRPLIISVVTAFVTLIGLLLVWVRERCNMDTDQIDIRNIWYNAINDIISNEKQKCSNYTKEFMSEINSLLLLVIDTDNFKTICRNSKLLSITHPSSSVGTTEIENISKSVDDKLIESYIIMYNPCKLLVGDLLGNDI